jgi:hypothetical protein
MKVRPTGNFSPQGHNIYDEFHFIISRHKQVQCNSRVLLNILAETVKKHKKINANLGCGVASNNYIIK